MFSENTFWLRAYLLTHFPFIWETLTHMKFNICTAWKIQMVENWSTSTHIISYITFHSWISKLILTWDFTLLNALYNTILTLYLYVMHNKSIDWRVKNYKLRARCNLNLNQWINFKPQQENLPLKSTPTQTLRMSHFLNLFLLNIRKNCLSFLSMELCHIMYSIHKVFFFIQSDPKYKIRLT